MAFKKEVLKAWRLRKGYTQTIAAEEFNMTQAFYSHLEVGRKTPSLETLEIISNRTGIPVSSFLDGSDDKTHSNPTPPSLDPATALRADKPEAVNA